MVAGQTGTGSVSGPALTAWNGVWRRPIARLGCVTAPDNRTVRLDTVQTNSRRPSWTVGDRSPGSVGATSATPCHPPIRWEPARPVPATGPPATPVCRGTRWGRQYGSVVGRGGGGSTGLSWEAGGWQDGSVVGGGGATVRVCRGTRWGGRKWSVATAQTQLGAAVNFFMAGACLAADPAALRAVRPPPHRRLRSAGPSPHTWPRRRHPPVDNWASRN